MGPWVITSYRGLLSGGGGGLTKVTGPVGREATERSRGLCAPLAGDTGVGILLPSLSSCGYITEPLCTSLFSSLMQFDPLHATVQ